MNSAVLRNMFKCVTATNKIAQLISITFRIIILDKRHSVYSFALYSSTNCRRIDSNTIVIA